jgi:hypothetical protein
MQLIRNQLKKTRKMMDLSRDLQVLESSRVVYALCNNLTDTVDTHFYHISFNYEILTHGCNNKVLSIFYKI